VLTRTLAEISRKHAQYTEHPRGVNEKRDPFVVPVFGRIRAWEQGLPGVDRGPDRHSRSAAPSPKGLARGECHVGTPARHPARRHPRPAGAHRAEKYGGVDGTRTRDLLRDRQAF